MTSTLTLPSRITARVDGHTDTIITSSVVGNGGEGIVSKCNFGGKEYAVKVIFPSMRSQLRFDKLKAQIHRVPSMPNRTVKPLKLVYDDDTNQVIGLAMELLAIDMYDELSHWMDVTWRTDNNVTFEEVVSVFYEIREELELLHKAGYTIGDFNPGGVLILKKQHWNDSNEMRRVRIVDADTVAFDNYPCLVYTMAYLDPQIPTQQASNGDIELLSGFKPEHDLFAFDALFLQALTTANVWDGYHPIYQMSAKINYMKGWTVLHDDVDYPTDALPFEDLPDVFQRKFRESFLDGKRELFPVEAFQQALGIASSFSLRKRQSTPAVSDVMVNLLETLFSGLGDIVDFTIAEGAINILTRDANGDYAYHVYYMGRTRQEPVRGTRANYRYRILSSGYVIENAPKSNSDFVTLRIYNVLKHEWFDVATVTGLRQEPIIAGGGNRVVTADAKNYLTGIGLGDSNEHSRLKTVNRNTSVKYDPQTGNIAGYILTMTMYSWFFVRGQNAYDISLTPLEETEYVKDWTVKFYQNRAVVIRLTELKGQLYTRIDEVNLSTVFRGANKDRLVNSLEPIDGELFKPLDSCEYAFDRDGNGVLFYATNNGIQRDNLSTGETTLFDATKNLVQRGTKIRLFGNGMVLAHQDRVDYVEM